MRADANVQPFNGLGLDDKALKRFVVSPVLLHRAKATVLMTGQDSKRREAKPLETV